VLGDVSTDHQIGHTGPQTAYRRSLSYIKRLAGPVYTDSASVETEAWNVASTCRRGYARRTASSIGPPAPFTTYAATRA
jgi:hypothetical protein